MNQQATLPATPISFKVFLLDDRRHKLILLLSAAAIVLQFALFKHFYPYPSFIHDDSFVYLDTATKNLDINSYLVGYSRFLRLFSAFTSSDTILVAFQYLFVQTSALFFLLTIFYFYKPGRRLQILLLCCMVFNPLFLYMANMVSSDCFFLALSFAWFTLLLWIIHRPTMNIMLWHAIVLFIAFTVRYNALIYPLISLIAFWLAKLPLKKKIAGYIPGMLLCGLFILYTGNKYKELTGTWQYAPFSGWQLANNAMYAYRYVDSADRKPVPARFKALDNSIRVYFDSTRNTLRFPLELLQASTFYMWRRNFPLFRFRDKQFKNDTVSSDLKKWASMGPLYKDYGLYIIQQYPQYFARYFLWPNAIKYYAPPIEYLEKYNDGRENIRPVAQDWFGYKDGKVTTRLKKVRNRLLTYYPILAGTMNGVFLCALLCYFLLNGFRISGLFKKGVLFTASFWLINAGFSIFSTAAALRFLAFPILLMSIFSLLLIDWMLKTAMNMEGSKLRLEVKNKKTTVTA